MWINKSNGLTGYELTTLAIDKQGSGIIYAGAKGFLFKTVDGGDNWKNIFRVPGINKAVNFIAINSENPKIIYIAAESGIFKSENSGTSWQAMPLGAEKDNVLSLLIDSENKNTLFAGTERGIFITKDAGRNWTKSSGGLSGINIQSVAQNYIDGKILFAAAENGLFKSKDGGKKWTKIFFTDSILDKEESENGYGEEYDLLNSATWVSVDPFDSGTIYLSTKKGVFKSGDNGNSWTRLSKIGLLNSNIKNFVLSSYDRGFTPLEIPNQKTKSLMGFIFAATEKGVFRFSEKENIWRELYNGLTSKKTLFVALNDRQDTLWLVTEKGIFKSDGNIYPVRDIKNAELSPIDKAKAILRNFSHEPAFRKIQEAAIEYAEVHPEKIAKWRRAAKSKALLPKLTFGIDRDIYKTLKYANNTWSVGPEDEKTGWDITCTWDLGELIYNGDQTLIDVRSKLMVQLRDDILDEVTHLYFERRRLQIELIQNPPEDLNKLIEKELRLQELTAGIDAMTGGYLSNEIERRKI